MKLSIQEGNGCSCYRPSLTGHFLHHSMGVSRGLQTAGISRVENKCSPSLAITKLIQNCVNIRPRKQNMVRVGPESLTPGTN